LLIVEQSGSGYNCGISVVSVLDPGEKKATSGDVSPGDTQGSVAEAKPDIGQKLGEMFNMLGGIQGNLTEALDFENLKGNLLPFESIPNKAVSDYFTLVEGGAGQPDTEKPSPSAIQKAISKVKDVAPAIPDLPFAGPTPNMPSIDLAMDKAKGTLQSLGVDSLDDAKAAFKKVQAKIDSGTA